MLMLWKWNFQGFTLFSTFISRQLERKKDHIPILVSGDKEAWPLTLFTLHFSQPSKLIQSEMKEFLSPLPFHFLF